MQTYFRTTNNQQITYTHGTQIGPIPTQVSDGNLDYPLIVTDANVESLDSETALALIRMTQVQQLTTNKKNMSLIASGSVAVPSGVTSIATGQQSQTDFVPKEYVLIFTGEIANTTVSTVYGQTYLATPLAGVDVAPVFTGFTPISYSSSLYTIGLCQEYGNMNIQVGGAGYEFVFGFAVATTSAATLSWQLYGFD